MRATALALLLALPFGGTAVAWGPEGHSIVAEVAQQRLSPQAAATVQSLLGGRSLASVASWADDVRDQRPGTSQWHFVDIPLDANQYEPSRDCKASPEGDCVVAELNRLKTDLRCAGSTAAKLDALRFAVHFLGDIHQPLHAVGDERGGNGVAVVVFLKGIACTQACKTPQLSNFHAAWDSDLIHAAVFAWGAYVDRLEAGWLKTPAAQKPGIDGGTPTEWALETHAAAQTVWNLLPPDHMIGDGYFQTALPVLDRQLGVAGLRLARFLNEAYASSDCTSH
jgi:hypothetical protein